MTQSSLKKPMVLALISAVFTIALKVAAYALTGSVGLLSDAAESGVNVMAAVTGLVSLWYSALPVDTTHTYGHEKIEFFASGLEGLLILLAAIGIASYAVQRLLVPQELESLNLGMILASVAGLIYLIAGQILLRVGRARQSIVLEGHGRHWMSDVWTTVAVLVGLALVRITGIRSLDPLFGLGMAAFIVWTGFELIRRSFNGLMDHALPEGEQTLVRAAIKEQLEPGMDFHALRTRMAGAHRFADCHLLVPGNLSVESAHAVAERIENAVRTTLPGMEVTVHIEPIEEKAAWTDSALVPLEIAKRQAEEKA
jgi:cation diffusion facilitator family transporter